MKSDFTLSRPLAVFRPRFRRLLSGKYSSGDITDLFRFLRSTADRESVVREIGDLIAHPEERDKGRSVSRLQDTLAAKAWVVRIMNDGAPSMNGDWIAALQRNLRGMNDEVLNAYAQIPLPSHFPEPPRFTNYSQLCQEANAAIRRLRKQKDGTYSFNVKSQFVDRDRSVLLFLNDRHPITHTAFEMAELMSDLWMTLLKSGLATENDSDAVARLEAPIGAFIISQLHRSTIKSGGNEYHLKANRSGPTPPNPPDNPHPVQYGSVWVFAEIASVPRNQQKDLGDSGLVFCVYGRNENYCERALLDKGDWSGLTLELSECGKLTFVEDQ
ncbi:MAG: hypothetical protein JJU24_03370 [Natronohydrobacter sp.]|nr:hypothetical protein [Natronohydrobacter sp.]